MDFFLGDYSGVRLDEALIYDILDLEENPDYEGVGLRVFQILLEALKIYCHDFGEVFY